MVTILCKSIDEGDIEEDKYEFPKILTKYYIHECLKCH